MILAQRSHPRQIFHDLLRRALPRPPLVEDPDATEIAVEGAAPRRFHAGRRHRESVVVVLPVASGQLPCRQRQRIQVRRLWSSHEPVTPILERHHANHAAGVVARLQRIGQLQPRPLALPNNHGIHGRAGEQQITRDQGSVMPTGEDRDAGPCRSYVSGGLQGGVDVGREAAADAHRSRSEITQVGPQSHRTIEAQVDDSHIVTVQLHRRSHTLQTQRLDQQYFREPEARALRRLNQGDTHFPSPIQSDFLAGRPVARPIRSLPRCPGVDPARASPTPRPASRCLPCRLHNPPLAWLAHASPGYIPAGCPAGPCPTAGVYPETPFQYS